jgi:two-component system, response regulator PdtaR
MRINTMLLTRAHPAIKRLLVVEDEPLVAFDNEHFLMTEGYEVVATVDNAADALTALTAHRGKRAIDAVLLDVNLADGQSGFDVARAARDLGVAVLFLTGSIPENAADLALAALAKPYGQRDLAAALKALDAMLAGEEPQGVPTTVQLFGRADSSSHP